MEEIEDCICFLAAKAAQQVTRRARRRLSPFGVSPAQYAVLKVLWKDDRQSGSQVGERLQLDSASMTGLLDRLEGAGLVVRQDDPADRRVHLVCLTDAGRALEAPLDAAMDAINDEAAAAMGRETAAVRRGLRALGDKRGWARS